MPDPAAGTLRTLTAGPRPGEDLPPGTRRIGSEEHERSLAFQFCNCNSLSFALSHFLGLCSPGFGPQLDSALPKAVSCTATKPKDPR